MVASKRGRVFPWLNTTISSSPVRCAVMEWDPESRRVKINWLHYRLPAGACAPAALIRALCRLTDANLQERAAPLQAIVTSAARWEVLLQWEMNAIHDTDRLCKAIGHASSTIHLANEDWLSMVRCVPDIWPGTLDHEVIKCREL